MNKAFYTNRPQRKFPLSTTGLEFIQQQILLAAAYAQTAGGNYILYGCEVTGFNVSPGALVIDGEILPFYGGVLQTKIRIIETKENVISEGETYVEAYIRRRVEFGSNLNGIHTFNWADLKRFPTNRYIAEMMCPNTRRINGLALDTDLSLSATEVGAATGIEHTRGVQSGDYLLAYNSTGEGFLLDARRVIYIDWKPLALPDGISGNISIRLLYGELVCKGAIDTSAGNGEEVVIPVFEIPFDMEDKSIEVETTDDADNTVALIIEIVDKMLSIKVNATGVIMLNFKADLL